MPDQNTEGRQEAVDHKARAAEMIGTIIDGPQDPRNPGAAAYLIAAQAHATLAVAEQLERLNDQLAEVIKPASFDPGGRGLMRGYLRTAVNPDV